MCGVWCVCVCVMQRFSDFHVREVGTDGVTAVLTNYDLPSEEDEGAGGAGPTVAVGDASAAAAADSQDLTVDSTQQQAVMRLRELVGEEAAGRLERFATEERAPETEADATFTELIETGQMDKGTRTEVHKAVREGYPALDSTTVPATEEQPARIRVVRRRRGGGGGGGRGGRGGGGRGGGRHRVESWWQGKAFCKFVLYKENKSTMDAVGLVKKFLRLKNERALAFAGNKDKRGITTQWVTAHKIKPDRLLALNAKLFGIRLGNFSYVDEGINVGGLVGNSFRVVLRDVSGTTDEQVAVVAESLRTVGYKRLTCPGHLLPSALPVLVTHTCHMVRLFLFLVTSTMPRAPHPHAI